VGALLGAAFQFLLGDRYGRKTNNIGGAILVVVGAVLQSSTTTLAQFLVGRLVAGFGLGCMTTVIPIWLTECANRANRGECPDPGWYRIVHIGANVVQVE
jgi:MFS family permease